jgi:hypothetical protein
MKNFTKFWVFLLVVGLLFIITNCKEPDDKDEGEGEDVTVDIYAQYYEGAYRDNKNGSVEVINPTKHDMLLFKNNKLIDDNILSGVRNGDTAQINFSDERDYIVGGYKIIYAVKQSEYEKAKGDSKVDYTAMVTYRNGSPFSITLISRYDGNYQFTSFNRNTDWPMELRKNTYEGEKIAFLAKGETFYEVKTADTKLFTVYPVWIAYNNVSKSIVSFCPKDDILSVQLVQPVLPEEDNAPLYFPGGGTSTITFEIDLPFATVQVQNNTSLITVFRVANGIKTPQSNYQGIRSGTKETYEIRSEGVGLDLNLAVGPMQNLKILVRDEDDPTIEPVIENGWIYTVNLKLKDGGDPTVVTDYTAWLVKGSQINQKQFLTAE